MSDAILHLPTSVDEALLEATRIGMLAEQTGLPLLPWQQRAIDLACIVDRTGARPHLPAAGAHEHPERAVPPAEAQPARPLVGPVRRARVHLPARVHRPHLGRRRHVRTQLRAVPRDEGRPVHAEAQVEEGRPRRSGQHDRGE